MKQRRSNPLVNQKIVEGYIRREEERVNNYKKATRAHIPSRAMTRRSGGREVSVKWPTTVVQAVWILQSPLPWEGYAELVEKVPNVWFTYANGGLVDLEGGLLLLGSLVARRMVGLGCGLFRRTCPTWLQDFLSNMGLRQVLWWWHSTSMLGQPTFSSQDSNTVRWSPHLANKKGLGFWTCPLTLEDN